MDDPGRDTVFTIEYSGRTAMEAVYVLNGVEKGVPEVYASRYYIRYLLNAGVCLLDGENIRNCIFIIKYNKELRTVIVLSSLSFLV